MYAVSFESVFLIGFTWNFNENYLQVQQQQLVRRYKIWKKILEKLLGKQSKCKITFFNVSNAILFPTRLAHKETQLINVMHCLELGYFDVSPIFMCYDKWNTGNSNVKFLFRLIVCFKYLNQSKLREISWFSFNKKMGFSLVSWRIFT